MRSPTTPSEQLSPRTRGRERSWESIDALFRYEYDAMLKLAFVFLRNQEDAEEVVQDSFLDLQRRWQSLLNPGGYLRTTVVNGARRRLARAGNRRRIRETYMTPSRTTPSPPGEPDYLVDLLDALPEQNRTAIILAYYLDYGSKEIAEVLGCRPGTAKSLVHRGLKRLRKELADD